MNSEIISCCCSPADTKANPSLFTDKQAFQEVKATKGMETGLKGQVSFTLQPVYSIMNTFLLVTVYETGISGCSIGDNNDCTGIRTPGP